MIEIVQLPTALTLFLVLASTCALAWYAMPVVINVSRMKNLLAVPEERSSHVVPIPTLGGIGIFIALITGICFWLGYMGLISESVVSGFPFVILSLIILFFVGIKDDLVVLSPKKKLIAQFIAAVIVAIGADIRLESFYGVLGLYELPYALSVVCSIVLYVFLVNAYNLIDGIDGLAGGLGVIAAVTFGIFFSLDGDMAYAVIAFSLAGALLGFLRFNFSKTKKIFMGDTGSMLLGFVLAVFALRFLQMDGFYQQYGVYNSPVVAVAILLIPIFDTFRVFLIRLMDKRNPFSPDKNHIHHILLRWDFSHAKASISLYSISMLLISMSTVFLSDFSINIFLGILAIILIASLFVYRDPKKIQPFRRQMARVRLLARGVRRVVLPQPEPSYNTHVYDAA